jgi:dephospho-CoA kinase
VFADPGARQRLNEIVHPLVAARMRDLEEQAAAAGTPVVVHDVPLLAENGLASQYDVVVVVDVAPRVQLERLVRERGLDRSQVQARIAAQASRADRLAVATYVVDNSGSLAELDRQAGELWSELRRRTRLPRD